MQRWASLATVGGSRENRFATGCESASAGQSLPYPLRTIDAGRCGCSIPISGADSPAAHFGVKGNPHVSATLVASG